MQGEVVLTPGVLQHTLTSSRSALPHAAPAAHEAERTAPSGASVIFSSLDLLAAGQEEGLPGLYGLLRDASQRDPRLLSRPMQELLASLENYLLKPRHLADERRLKQHLLHSGIFLDALLTQGQLSPTLLDDLKGFLNKALRIFLPHQVLMAKAGGMSFEHEPELAVQILHKNLPAGQKAIIGKLLQTEPWLNEYQQNTGTLEQTPVANRHFAGWLGHAIEEALCHIVQHQLHSFSDENQQHWRMSLYTDHKGDLLTIPVELQHSLAEEGAPWELAFTVKPPGGNTVKVAMLIADGAVTVHFTADDILTHQRLSRRQDRLRLALRSRGLRLEDMNSAGPGKQHG